VYQIRVDAPTGCAERLHGTLGMVALARAGPNKAVGSTAGGAFAPKVFRRSGATSTGAARAVGAGMNVAWATFEGRTFERAFDWRAIAVRGPVVLAMGLPRGRLLGVKRRFDNRSRLGGQTCLR
jgi:hypothetical protein